jgi:hypothetical protein
LTYGPQSNDLDASTSSRLGFWVLRRYPTGLRVAAA